MGTLNTEQGRMKFRSENQEGLSSLFDVYA